MTTDMMVAKIIMTGVWAFAATVAPTCALLSRAEASQRPKLTVQNVSKPTFEGSGCSKLNTYYDVIDGNFQLRFDELLAIAQTPGSEGASDCKVTVSVKPPAGYQLAILGATLEGTAQKTGDGYADVTHSYTIFNADGGNNGMEETWNTDSLETEGELTSFTSPLNSPFDIDSVPDEWRGGCGKPTKLEGNLALQAQGNGNGSAEIYLDRQIGGGNAAPARKLQWDWELLPCNSAPDQGDGLMNGAWNFSYKAANGRIVSGRMTVQGEAGSYRPAGATWTGQLNGLKKDGEDVRGSWTALESAGWVVFKPSSDGSSFTGEWGFDGNHQAAGFWNGNKAP